MVLKPFSRYTAVGRWQKHCRHTSTIYSPSSCKTKNIQKASNPNLFNCHASELRPGVPACFTGDLPYVRMDDLERLPASFWMCQ